MILSYIACHILEVVSSNAVRRMLVGTNSPQSKHVSGKATGDDDGRPVLT
jgi:hypothetical protein